jgi:hypothetical protein
MEGILNTKEYFVRITSILLVPLSLMMYDLIHSTIAASNQAASCNGKIITSGGACSGRNTHDGGGQQRPHRVRGGRPLIRGGAVGFVPALECCVQRESPTRREGPALRIFHAGSTTSTRKATRATHGLSTSSAT